ncbi:ABC transporter permease subunit [Mesorhizobium sp. M1C.F.Ca.ET.193.01.1.1]|uniref:ABC transporter permease subunit n=1 Tax=unclassified Mesorhizobium TaxID=325217 RepID=UPI000FD1A418|nr:MULTISPECIES: ABC transporter permease subunit [unclassified Mesorhizobium]TGS95157.1 ABC transporter permease subunit [bacterium M00.F.Ca.ET.177.01.1.1]TGQ51492.1 ABC transporter permease subunit [Mesorhizobium sp. M1C.F.Ca.ET.210.01.1.1]TGQ67285.1 ABC transporter permease subunit [Mesorhizobium sp. M1C.F.Ca.ET.212.01.1.1]TGR02168.1 ABC transporter permease subunit [Mesorhizobium sp. M1C.F.Ca.ET.204.01.1.1]TGR22858.1 ABC transporter permease subunit [Mesorhizobium sp. M1C.F.Ca.ET.196.01.1.
MSISTYTERPAAKISEIDTLSVPWSRPRPKRAGVSARLVSALTILALLAAWTVSAELQLVSPVFLPSPAAVWAKLVVVARDGFVDATLFQHLTASLGRVFAALIVAIVVGVPVGLAIGISRIGRGVFDPLLEFLRPIPPLAYLPLIVIWFGIGEPSKILVIAIAMLAPVALSTAAGVRGVSRERIDAARSLGATRGQVVRHVVLPSTLPSILTGLRIALGAGWSTLVAAELVAATRGLGFMIQSAAQFLVTDVVVMGILVIATIAFALEFVIRRIERALVPWAGRE